MILKKLGIEKVKVFESKFDDLYDKYSTKAKSLGFHGELKFIKEHGKVLVYVIASYQYKEYTQILGNDENTGYLTSLKQLTSDKIPNVNDIIIRIIATIDLIKLYINFYIYIKKIL